MIISKGTYTYEGFQHTIGERVLANDMSDYEGLYGKLLEIRTDSDKDTDNEGPDFYCSFEVPSLDEVKKKVEKRFSELYQQQVSMDDIALDEVIMSPDMLKVIPENPSYEKTGSPTKSEKEEPRSC